MGKILVAFVTKTGTTREAAMEIGAVLTENGFEVEVKPVSGVGSLAGYTAAIVGAPINGMQWVAEAGGFVEANNGTLKSMPTALFAVSYMHAHGRANWRDAIDKNLARYTDMVSPLAMGIFGGRLASPLPGPARFLFGLPKELPLDISDKREVRAWAEKIAGVLPRG